MVSEERKLKVRATSLRYYYNHKDELKAKRKRYYEANKRRYLDSRREYARRYYEANKERIIAKSLHLNMEAEYLTSNRWSERCMDCHKLYTPTGSATKGSSDNRCYNCRIEYRRNYMADLMRERRAEERQ